MCQEFSFGIDYLDYDVKENKTVNNDVNIKSCGRETVRKEICILSDRPAYAFRIKLSCVKYLVLE